MKKHFLVTMFSLGLLCCVMFGPAMRVSASESMRGDVDRNGTVNTTDARLVLQYAVEKIDSNDLDLSVADVNRSEKVDTTDARLILQYAVDKIAGFDQVGTIYPTYAEFSDVPDFGTMYGVAEDYRSYEDGDLFVFYTYSDIYGVNGNLDILSSYKDVLESEYGFSLDRTTENSDGKTNFWLENRDGSITIALSFWDDSWSVAVFDNTGYTAAHPTYSEFPSVPDFGAMYGVAEDYRSYEDGDLFVFYTYSDIYGVNGNLDILSSYQDVLKNEYGFSLDRTTENSDGRTNFWFESTDGSITIALSFWDDAWSVAIFD